MRYSSPQPHFARREQPHQPMRRQATVDPRRLRARMVREQIAARGITDPLVLNAMATVPRHLFVPEALGSHAYDDTPLPIGLGQTISQPYMVARMSQLLQISRGMRVLEIGAGSGYQAAVLAAMGCTVYAIERLDEICATTKTRLRRLGLGAIHLYKGDGTLGFPMAAPYNRILVSAGGPQIPPPLVSQLADNGIMLIPVGDRPRTQRLMRIRKVHGFTRVDDVGPATFVNLVGNHGWGE